VALAAIRDTLGQERPDLAHVHHWFNLSTGVVALAAELGIPVALSFHDLFAVCPRFFRYRADGACPAPTDLSPCERCSDEDYPFSADERKADLALRTAAIRRDAAAARRHLFPSRAHRDLLVPLLGSEDARVAVIPHGVLPLPEARDPREPWPARFSPERPLRLGYWGNMVAMKGVSDLLAVTVRLHEAGLPVALDLWGRVLEPGLEDQIRAAAARAPVRVHGDFTRARFTTIAGRTDLACFVSALRESYSFTADEALALGIPVLVSDRGAPRERVGEAGRVVPAEDPDALERVVRELVGDPAALAAMAGAAAPPPPVAEAGRRLLAVYGAILSEGPVVPPPAEDLRPRLAHLFRKLCAREAWLHDLMKELNG
jgi:glycosyltransferase involved in cell wall biosynthesis